MGDNNEELNMENILSDLEIGNLFDDTDNNEDIEKSDKNSKENEDNDTTEVDLSELFADGKPESVGSGKDNIEGLGNDDPNKGGISPNDNFYSSIASALKDSTFPDLDISDVKSADKFAESFEKLVQSRLDETQKRINDALNANVEPDVIRQHENAIQSLNNITEQMVKNEGEQGSNLRKQLIYQDYINKGYSKERASREVQKSFNANTDDIDALEALTSIKEYHMKNYQDIVNSKRAEQEKEISDRKKESESLSKSILEDKKIFGDLEVDAQTRKKIIDNISKPVYKDPNSGELLTAVQKYERENHTDFMKNLGLIYTLTDGFKNLNGLLQGKVKKEVKNSLRDLEFKLNTTARNDDGSLKFISGTGGDDESIFTNGFSLDI